MRKWGLYSCDPIPCITASLDMPCRVRSDFLNVHRLILLPSPLTDSKHSKHSNPHPNRFLSDLPSSKRTRICKNRLAAEELYLTCIYVPQTPAQVLSDAIARHTERDNIITQRTTSCRESQGLFTDDRGRRLSRPNLSQIHTTIE